MLYFMHLKYKIYKLHSEIANLRRQLFAECTAVCFPSFHLRSIISKFQSKWCPSICSGFKTELIEKAIVFLRVKIELRW